MSETNLKFHDLAPETGDFYKAVVEGLSQTPRSIPPEYFYDNRGSELFDIIRKQPEYYLSRTETSLLQYYADEISACIGPNRVLVGLGNSANDKARLLFDHLKPIGYVSVDVSKASLFDSVKALAHDYPWLEMHAIYANFSQVPEVPRHSPHQQSVAFYPESNIGHFEPDDAVICMEEIARIVGNSGKLLVGVDIKKEEAIFNAAYNDAAGVTAEFNLNLLTRMRNELGAKFEDGAFAHQAFYDESKGCIEMHLVSTTNTVLTIGDKRFSFYLGDSIHTRNAYQYSLEEFKRLAEYAGFNVERTWTDRKNLFSVQLLGVDNRP